MADVSPGLVAQVRWNVWSELFVDLEARVHFYVVRTEEGFKDKDLNAGYLDLFAGLGWNF